MNITKTSPAAPTPASVATNAARSAAPAREASAAATVVASGAPTKTAPAGESVSVSKVAQMRAAIESGTFKIDAGKIADGLIRSGDLGR